MTVFLKAKVVKKLLFYGKMKEKEKKTNPSELSL